MLHGLPIGVVSAQTAAYLVEQSLLFDGAAYLSRTPGSAGNRKTLAFDCWAKVSAPLTFMVLFCAYTDANNHHGIWLDSNGRLNFRHTSGGSNVQYAQSNALFRDASGWYHFAAIYDSTTETHALYANGTQLSLLTDTTPTLNADGLLNSTVTHYVGQFGNSSGYWEGAMALPRIIDGAAVAITDLLQFNDDNTIQPKRYTGSYGTNGGLYAFGASNRLEFGKDTGNKSYAYLIGNGTASASSESTPASNAFGRDTSFWYPTSTGASVDGSHTLNYDFGEAVTVTGAALFQQYQGYLNSVLLEYSSDDVSYSTAATFTAGDVGNPSALNVQTFGGISARYWRIRDNAGTVNGGGSYWTVNELMLFGTGTEQGLNYFSPSGFSNSDQLADSPTDDADLGIGSTNALSPSSHYGYWNGAATLSEGNTKLTQSASAYDGYAANFPIPTTGKWGFKVTLTTVGGGNFFGIGVNYEGAGQPYNANADVARGNSRQSHWKTGVTVEPGDTQVSAIYDGVVQTTKTGGATVSSGDYFEFLVDRDAGTVDVLRNGSAYRAQWTGLPDTDVLWPEAVGYGGTVYDFDFGQFGYTPSDSSYKTLATQNLPAATISNPAEYFNTVLYTGDDAATHAITGVGFAPDLVWLKNRDSTYFHHLADTVRGDNSALFSNATNTENTDTNRIKTLDSDGFTLGSNVAVNDGTTNTNFVAWCWKANGSGSSNTDGSITSTVSANTTAGFSIVGYTGTGSAATVGHGLGVAPDFAIFKSRTQAGQDWLVGHSSLNWAGDEYLLLNSQAAKGSAGARWNTTAPTSSVISLGTGGENNGSGQSIIAYCWNEVEGFSKFGSYIGNGSADGPFVYTGGFKPAFTIIKQSSAAGSSWVLHDAQRDTYNVVGQNLFADTSAAESTFALLDYLSNGIKIRSGDSSVNASGQTYIYAAFAEAPFQGGATEITQGRAR